jgi:Fur family transcriptional regulator, ferric uptake regulator
MTAQRNTVCKKEILRVLSGTEVALSQGEIIDRLQVECNRVTVYRILLVFEEQGLIHRAVGKEGTVKYMLCQSCTPEKHFHNHLHFSCEGCGQMTCLQEFNPEYSVPKGFQVSSTNFVLTGRCPNCH